MSLNFDVEALYTPEGLLNLHNKFQKYLLYSDQSLYQRLHDSDQLNSELIIELSIYIEDFIIDLFHVKQEAQSLCNYNNSYINIHTCKRQFIQRYAVKNYKIIDNYSEVKAELQRILDTDEITEKLYANTVMKWWSNKEHHQYELEVAAKYAVWMVQNSASSALFNLPVKIDYNDLIDTESYRSNSVKILKSCVEKKRYGFRLTDNGIDTITAVDHSNYCIFCHKQNKDSCSKGLCDKDGNYKISPTKTKLTGCPLDQKISEMNLLKSQGYNIAALAVIALDNPMCAATGHRICNDCMRSCIYQKQTPVNVPGIETNILSEVLSLPYGFEIYSLLTRWNPLNIRNPTPKTITNYKVLVVGLGPAGFTMAHHLLNEGHIVIAIDGLKIEPLPSHISGRKSDGERVKFTAIKDINSLYEELDERVTQGFGGVAEYGITVRWNKNYLKIIRLLLERRRNFMMYGGVRFGSNITYQDTSDLGFHHIALALGSGRPNVIQMKNILANGVKMASDFLMSLQLGGAYKAGAITNLQIRMPIVVIGGGLTAIDTATEALHYYQVQIEKFVNRYQKLISEFGYNDIECDWTGEDREIAKEFLQHYQLLQNSSSTLKELGGAKVLYRNTLQESPAYRLNHEEVDKAFAEGIEFIENFIPAEIVVDEHDNAQAVKGYIGGEERVIRAKTILMATGTRPNDVLSREDPDNFQDFINNPPHNVTILGDIHPKYTGSVVKAMASAKNSYPTVTQKLTKLKIGSRYHDFLHKIDNKLIAKVVDVIELSPKIYEIIIKAPLAAQHFSPGQFYRLQNYESNALVINNTKMLMEGLAVTGAKVDTIKGIISTIVLDTGGSSHLCKYLKKNEQVVLMGPTGKATEIPKNETVMLIGGGLGNAVLFSIGQAMRKNGCRVLYFAGYNKADDRFKVAEIEKAADVIIWACDEKELTKTRDQDFSLHGNIIEAINHYQKNNLGLIDIKFQDIDRMVVIGSDKMMSAVNHMRYTNKEYFKPHIKTIASINSPMQCMMKEICAQCLQRHVDPITKQETFTYSCFNQDQDMNSIDFCHLRQRLKQNSLQEKLTKYWMDCCLK